MTEAITDIQEFPRKGSSSSSIQQGYSVEARCTHRPQVIAGTIYHTSWEKVSPEQSELGVPTGHPFFNLARIGLMSYPAAEAIRWWLHAIAESQNCGIGLETRIIKHEIKTSESSTPVSAHKHIHGDDRSNLMPDWGVKS